MPFKEGVIAEDVHAIRAFVMKADAIEESIDAGTTTPHEALGQLEDALGEVDLSVPGQPVPAEES